MKKSKPTSPFPHSYPDAPGVTHGSAGAGTSPHKHPYPAGGMGVVRSDMQGASGHSPHQHDYPHAVNPRHPGNHRGSKRKPLTMMLKNRSRGVAKAWGARP